MTHTNSARPCRQQHPLPCIGFEDFLGRLEGVHRHGDDRAEARCPAHGDKHASLSVQRGTRGALVVVHCHAGCSFESILAAVGVEPAQFFERDDTWRPTLPRRDPEREARQDFESFAWRHAAPPPERTAEEARALGLIMLGGTAAFANMTLDSTRALRTPGLRIIYEAVQRLARQGSQWHSFPPCAVAREVDDAGGPGTAAALGVLDLARGCVRAARRRDP